MTNQKIQMSPLFPCMLLPLPSGLPGMVVVEIPFFAPKFGIFALTKLGLFGVKILSKFSFFSM